MHDGLDGGAVRWEEQTVAPVEHLRAARVAQLEAVERRVGRAVHSHRDRRPALDHRTRRELQAVAPVHPGRAEPAHAYQKLRARVRFRVYFYPYLSYMYS